MKKMTVHYNTPLNADDFPDGLEVIYATYQCSLNGGISLNVGPFYNPYVYGGNSVQLQYNQTYITKDEIAGKVFSGRIFDHNEVDYGSYNPETGHYEKMNPVYRNATSSDILDIYIGYIT